MKSPESVVLIFDWGDTIMRDFNLPGKMSVWEKVEWIPGAQEALSKLSEKYICCIATSAAHSSTIDMVDALKRVGADQFFSFFFSSFDLGFYKPDPRFFISISEKLKVDASKCIMIGNLYEKDIVGAKQAGMKTILFNETKSVGDFQLADLVIFEMRNLVNAVNKLKTKLI